MKVMISLASAERSMSVVAHLKDLSTAFFEGIKKFRYKGFNEMEPREQLEYVYKRRHELGIKMKFGTGGLGAHAQFKELMKSEDLRVRVDVDRRTGYPLVTFYLNA